MVWMFVWLGITLAAAGVVFLFASVVARSESPSADDQGLRAFWRDFRSGLRLRRAPRRDADGRAVGPVRMPKPVETSMDEFFTATQVSSRAYVDAEELTDVLHRARERATRPLHGYAERVRPEPAGPVDREPSHGA
jgi:selenocysteine lyase/cysteine desulfurase